MNDQNYSGVISVRAAAILTLSYVAGTILENVQEYDQIIIEPTITIGNATDIRIIVEFSMDGTNYARELGSAYSAGATTTIANEYILPAASGRYRIAIPIKDRFIKISVKGTVDITGTSATIQAALGSS